MELQYFGGNCLRINTKKTSIVIDDNLADLGKKSITKADDIVVLSQTDFKTPISNSRMIFNLPGEYEVAGVALHGIAARAHMDEEGKHSATIFKIEADDCRLICVGHIYPELSDEQLEAIGMVDVLVIPVGGNGYTLDPIGALKIIKKIEPKVVIPVHYASKGLKYEVAQQELTEFMKAFGSEPIDTIAKYKIKTTELSDTAHLLILEEQ